MVAIIRRTELWTCEEKLFPKIYQLEQETTENLSILLLCKSRGVLKPAEP